MRNGQLKLKLWAFVTVHSATIAKSNVIEITTINLPIIGILFEQMKFLGIEWLRISRKLNISVARERQARGLGSLVKLHHR